MSILVECNQIMETLPPNFMMLWFTVVFIIFFFLVVVGKSNMWFNDKGFGEKQVSGYYDEIGKRKVK